MTKLNPAWPILKSYDQEHLGCIGMPLGGIGTGTVSLGGRGNLFNYELHNKPRKDNSNYGLFVLYTRSQGEDTAALRALEGVFSPPYEGASGFNVGPYGDFPRFRECSFHTAYPFAQVCLDDPASPLEVRLEAFNPLIPNDPDNSGIPMAILRYVLSNKKSVPVEATVCGIHKNGIAGKTENQRNHYRDGAAARGLVFDVTDDNTGDRLWGSKALATGATDVSHTCHWRAESWGRSTLHFCDDLLADGRLDDYETDAKTPTGSLAASVIVPPNGQCEVTFVLSWHFPNRYSWNPKKKDCGCGCDTLDPADLVGNYYTGHYADAWDVISKEMPRIEELEAESLRFVNAFCRSDLPDVIKEAALFNVSTLRTETCFRTADGNFYAWEGCGDGNGCCSGSCTHVWNYETTSAFLFGNLARNMRETEFLRCTNPETGNMSFRVALPIEGEKGEGKAAADGQMGCIMKIYREWRLSGDTDWLQKLWPNVRKALQFCWIEGGWDADKDGVMEGCQHNTMDVEYYGPNPQMGIWYLGALRAAEEMARHLGQNDFADECRELFEKGSKWLDENLFNGEYYEQIVKAPGENAVIYPTLTSGMGSSDPDNPELQLGPGCLVDQLVGQYLAHACGLGYLLAPDHLQTTLESIMKYNFKEDFYEHLNHHRIYAINDESALLMASYPHGNRPESPFPYFTEIMTGFEYTAGIHMLYEGQVAPGMKVIEAIRKRYDGKRRNPFDEAECGHHYGRAMAAWTAILAWTGFDYDGATKTMRFAAKEGNWFWSNGYAYGTCEIRKAANGALTADLKTMHGTLELDALFIGDAKVS